MLLSIHRNRMIITFYSKHASTLKVLCFISLLRWGAHAQPWHICQLMQSPHFSRTELFSNNIYIPISSPAFRERGREREKDKVEREKWESLVFINFESTGFSHLGLSYNKSCLRDYMIECSTCNSFS